MKVKFCGMTNIEDVKCAVELGVDFVGFVFFRRSKRYIDPDSVRGIVERVSGRVKTVGVFVDETNEEIKRVMEYCGLDYAQVYRDVYGFKTIRVYRIKDKLPDVRKSGLVLFDSFTPSVGGSGVSFDFGLLREVNYRDRLFVAGGIDVDNVGFLVDLGVYAVDLVSSVEAYKGKKDPVKMEKFMKVVRGI